MTTLTEFAEIWAASYKSNKPVVTRTVSVDVEPQKLMQTSTRKKVAVSSAPVNPNRNTPGPTSPAFRSREKLDAKQFLDALRNAGKRNGKYDSNLEKQDTIEALSNFDRYFPGEPLGTQVDNARRKALTEVRGTGAAVPPKPSPNARVYVAGTPNGKGRSKADLARRIEVSEERRDNLVKLGLSSSGKTANQYAAEAAKENELILQYKNDLKKLG